jgi:IclR family KDG regulon transcriptional repressor
MSAGVQSVERSLRILDILLEADADPVLRERGVGIRTMTAELGVHRTTVLRLLTTLVDAGYAAPSTAPGQGREASPSQEVERFAKVARPFLAALVESTGECAHAAVADGGRVLVVDDVETDQPLRVVPTPGRHVPLHCTSAGKVLLAWGLAELPAALPGRTGRTITDPDLLRTHLAEVRERGWALDDRENDPHTRCISAPVLGAGGVAIGCVGIDAPSVRLTDERIPEAARAVVEAAERISSRLGHRGRGHQDDIAAREDPWARSA